MPPKEQNIHGDQWLDISDFSPGAFSHDNTVSGNQRLLPAPPGAHDPSGTFACLCLPNGGLGALQGVGETWDWPIEQGSGSVITYLGGLLIHDDLVNGTIEAIIIDEYDDGTNHFFFAASFILDTSTATSIVATTEASGGLNEFPYGSPYPFMTRMADVDPTTTAGQPVVVFTSASFAQDNGASGQLYVYPNPATPTLYNPLELIANPSPQSVTGQVLGHQSRVIILSGIGYDWPTGAGAMSINENINYTDPPNGDVLPAQSTAGQQTVLVAEEPFGYGCGGSISAGELFLVKHRGGGVVVTGDIFAPNVTYLPGVQPTGEGYGNADSGTAGFFYCSVDNGAWVWDGGNVSQKISPQLDDNFFHMDPAAENLSWYVRCIGDKVYFSNNWLYDTRTQSWWKYYPDSTQGGVDLFWTQYVQGPSFYAAKLSWLVGADTFLYRFDSNLANPHYQWRSMPLKLAGEDRVVDIREIVVRASSAVSDCAVTLTVLDAGNVVWGPEEQAGDVSDGPDFIRWNVGALGLTEPQIQVNVDNSGTPGDNAVIHSISVKYKQRAHIGTTN